MKKRTTKKTNTRKPRAVKAEVVHMPSCDKIARRGIHNGADMTALMSALISDITSNAIDARKANAICNAAGKILKTVEQAHRLGQPTQKTQRLRTLKLTE